MEKSCTCSDWKKEISYINGLCTITSIHDGGEYTGKFMDYCPWCGSKLTEVVKYRSGLTKELVESIGFSYIDPPGNKWTLNTSLWHKELTLRYDDIKNMWVLSFSYDNRAVEVWDIKDIVNLIAFYSYKHGKESQ